MSQEIIPDAHDVEPDFVDNVVPFPGAITRLPPKTAPRLKSAGGGGTFDDMEARVARLESDVAHIKEGVTEIKDALKGLRSDASTLRIDAATLTERVGHLPGKGFIVTAATLGVGAIVGLLTMLSKLGVLASQ